MTGKSVRRVETRARGSQARRRLAAATAGVVDCRPEALERRMLLSGTADLLRGPVTSAATAAWYKSRVAELQSLPTTHQVQPGFVFLNDGPGKPLQTAAPDPAGLTPTQLDNYYGFTGLKFGSTPADGRGQTIAVIDAFNDPNIAADLKTFDTAYGLAAPPSFTVVSQTGSTTDLPTDDVGDPEEGSWAVEESLDVEWAHAMAPGANILAVETNSQNDADLYAGVAYAASAPGVSAVSMSFGLSETNYTTTELAAIDPTFATPTGHQGVTFLAASGDQGAFADDGPLAVDFPSSSPYVVAVGGTTIATDSNGNPVSESAWSGSGGGLSVLETQTSAQKSAVGSYAGRVTPDVSFDADPDSGVNVCDSLDFSSATPFEVIGGTSFSSPAWASILAITNQGRVAAGQSTLDGRFQTIPDLYSAYTNGSYSTTFKDITTGNNGNYSATKGFDLTTGLGSPDVQTLVPQLVTNKVLSTPAVIGSFTISPAAEDVGTSITLTASDVTDTAGIVEGVNFYRVKGTASTLIGSGKVDASGNWTLSVATTGLAAGTYTYSAVATNNFSQNGKAVSATNKVVINQATPTIGVFQTSPGTEKVGTPIELIASGVTDTTSTIASVAFYLQTSTGLTLLGNDKNTAPGTWTLSAPTVGMTPSVYTYVAIATAASGLVSKPSSATNTVILGPPITVVVNTIKDQIDAKGSKTVSLRDAIGIADAQLGAVTIDFDPTVFAKQQTILLTGSTLSLTDVKASTTINGPAAGVVVSGGGLVEVFAVAAKAVVTLSNLTITDGDSSGKGGGLINAGIATLSHVTVSKNNATGLSSTGGGIENDGTLSLVDSAITDNSASDNGGGIFNTGNLTATQTTISGNIGNDGGGISSTGTATLSNSTISGNTADFVGGGISNYGSLNLSGSTMSGNTANEGAALYNAVIYSGPTNVVATLSNSTIADNHAYDSVGGIYNATGCTLTLAESTIVSNTAYGSFAGIENSGSAIISNSIVAANLAEKDTTAGLDVEGAFASAGHNLIGTTDGSSGWTAADYTGTIASPLTANLTPLGNFGGPTQTVVPLPGSDALGHGLASLVPTGTTTDQRGYARVVGGKVDIGAVQVQGVSPLKVTSAAAQSAIAGTSTSFNIGSLTDAVTKGPYTLVVSWGDGSTNTISSLASVGAIAAQKHAFDALGTFTASFVVADSAGNISNEGTFSVKVNPAALRTFVVNTVKDQTDPVGSKTVSLDDAITAADNGFGPVNISFDPTVFAFPQTIAITSRVEISDVFGLVSITGSAKGVTLSGGGDFNVFVIDSGVTASLTRLSVVDGVNGIVNSGNLTVVDSTISGNVATGDNGAGIINYGTLKLINSTVSDNSAPAQAYYGYGGPGGVSGGNGGAIYNSGKATLTNVTITGNTGTYVGGVDNSPAGTLTLANTIIAGNSAAAAASTLIGDDVSGTITSLGHNLIGETSGSTGWTGADDTGTHAKPLAADLSPLGNFGGPTQTVVPAAGSPALGHGSTALIPVGISTDQRGDSRIVGGKVDIGAVEVQRTSPITVTPPAAQSVFAGLSASINLGSFADSVTTKGPFTLYVNWGDGSAITTASLTTTGAIAPRTHTFASLGTFTVSFVVANAAGDVSKIGTFSVKASADPLLTITVNTSKDQTDSAGSSTVSLRDAVAIADARLGPVTIQFDPKVFASNKTITLTNDLEVSNSIGLVSIVGPAAGVNISGGGLTSILYVSLAVDVSLKNLSIVDGTATYARRRDLE